MAEDTDISKEAFERVRRERDDLKAKYAEAEQAIRDFDLRDRMADHFRQKTEVKDAYRAASAAIRDVTLKGVTVEELPQRLDSWLEEQRGLFATPAPEPEEKPPASPFQAPNPGTPGYEARVEPMVIGSERWNEWAKGRSAQEKLDAMRRGDAVSSEGVKRAQSTVKRGA